MTLFCLLQKSFGQHLSNWRRRKQIVSVPSQDQDRDDDGGICQLLKTTKRQDKTMMIMPPMDNSKHSFKYWQILVLQSHCLKITQKCLVSQYSERILSTQKRGKIGSTLMLLGHNSSLRSQCCKMRLFLIFKQCVVFFVESKTTVVLGVLLMKPFLKDFGKLRKSNKSLDKTKLDLHLQYWGATKMRRYFDKWFPS